MISCTPECPICQGLRNAALRIIGDGGVEALAQEALALEAGLSRSDAARHYATAAACLHATYEEVSDAVVANLARAFAAGSSWESALGAARRGGLAHMATHPAEARLCLIETLRGDRELRRRRERKRRLVIDFLAGQRRRFDDARPFSRLQIELLVGATFHEMSAAVAAGQAAELPAIEPRLSEFARVFDPAGIARPSTTATTIAP